MATPALISTSLSALTSSNTVLQLMGDINSLKTLAPLASATSSQADLANTNARIAQVNTNLTSTNTTIRGLITTDRGLAQAELANTNAAIASVSTTASAALPLSGGTLSGQLVVHSSGIQFSDSSTLTSAPSSGVSTGKAIAMAIVFG